MDILLPLCAGLDVHKDTVVACLRRVVKGKVEREVRTFGTTTRELLALSEWLASAGCRHVAMEATGVYWRPVWHVLEITSRSSWRTRCTSVTCRAARATRAMRDGSRICLRTG